MTTALNSFLLGQKVLHSNSLAVVTAHCIVFRDFNLQSHSVLRLSGISHCKTLKTAHAQLLVVASGFFLVAAAAQCSKQGEGAAIPCALVGVAFVVAYLASRRAAVVFQIDSGYTRTAFGAVREAAKTIAAIHSAQIAIAQPPTPVSLSPEPLLAPQFSPNFQTPALP